jgi:hypothetical protein
VIVGGVVSTTVMVWLTVADVLPEQSVALHVFVLVKVPGQLPGVVTSETTETTGFGSQASVAVGGVKTGVAGHSMVVLAPGWPITGGVVSTTVIVWLHDTELPQSSVAVVVRVLLKVPGQEPGVVTSLKVMVRFGSQLSENVGVPNTGVAGHWIVAFDGQKVTVGGVVSLTFTVVEQETVVTPVHPLHVTLSVIVYVALHVLPACTMTEEPLLGPTMTPFPLIVQLCTGLSQTPEEVSIVEVCVLVDPGQTVWLGVTEHVAHGTKTASAASERSWLPRLPRFQSFNRMW